MSVIKRTVIAAAIGIALGICPAAFAEPEEQLSDAKPPLDGATSAIDPERDEGSKTEAQKITALRVASWGGAYGEAQSQAIIDPARGKLKVSIERIEMDKGVPAFDRADVFEVRQKALRDGCQSGALVRIAPIELSPAADGSESAEDFVAGGLSECGVASFAWSALILVDLNRFKKAKPRRIADVFNSKRFPGKRAFVKSPENLLEMLTLAAGTPAAEVYDALAERETQDEIFHRLEQLLPHIVWVDSARDGLAKLVSGEVKFALGYSGRAFRKTIAGSLNAIWDGHVIDHASWAISADANDKELAKDFIVLATSPKMLAAQARLWPYGPMRKSATAMVGRHALLDVELAPFMPTSDERLAFGVRRDEKFWQEKRAELSDRLAALLEGFPKGVRVPPPSRRPAPPPAETDGYAD